MESVEGFGWQVAAEALRRGFYQAAHRAMVGDGGNWIEPMGDLHFAGWTQILDFLHLLTHLYAAATAACRGQSKLAWRLYERMLRAAWAGQVQPILTLLREPLDRLGPPPAEARDDDPRRIVAGTLAYVGQNARRMNYPQYRRDGLPVTSAAVESLIKQFNQRAYLSEDGRAEDFHARRPRARAAARNRLRSAA